MKGRNFWVWLGHLRAWSWVWPTSSAPNVTSWRSNTSRDCSTNQRLPEEAPEGQSDTDLVASSGAASHREFQRILEWNLQERRRRGWAKCPPWGFFSKGLLSCSQEGFGGWGAHQEAGKMLGFLLNLSWDQIISKRTPLVMFLLLWRRWRAGGHKISACQPPKPGWIFCTGISHWEKKPKPTNPKTNKQRKDSMSGISPHDGFGSYFNRISLPLSTSTVPLMNFPGSTGQGRIPLQPTPRRDSHHGGLGGKSKLDLLNKKKNLLHLFLYYTGLKYLKIALMGITLKFYDMFIGLWRNVQYGIWHYILKRAFMY